ncbi:GNAT family N-acetyltransferase [Nocardia terrae]|nr:GNAT family protein [Nocardia terrae]
MIWPMRIPVDRLDDGGVSLRLYTSADAEPLFDAIHDERVWEHIPRAIPSNFSELDSGIRAKLIDGQRITFSVRQGAVIVGTTSILYDPAMPDAVEIGATQFDPAVWGAGINSRAKALLVREVFAQGAAWIQFRTDERNGRSAAAIRKLGATDLGVHQDSYVRRDGSTRRSRFFRLERPQR